MATFKFLAEGILTETGLRENSEMWTTSRLCTSTNLLNAKQLYKYLMRECRKLPKNTQPYYFNFVRQGFGQHAEETDPERIRQIMQRAIEDSKWILNKYCPKK